MGIFKKKTAEEKAEKKQKKAEKMAYTCYTCQPLGAIAQGSPCSLRLNYEDNALHIKDKNNDIKLPFERLRGFNVENETTLAKSGSGIGRAAVGGALFGGAGAVVGGMSGKGNTSTKWIATLAYTDKDGNAAELNFIEWGMGENARYTGAQKSYNASQFEELINGLVSQFAEKITEL